MTTRYDAGARLFHWLVALLLIVQIPAGIAMIAPGLPQPTIDAIYVMHKGLGVVLLVILLARLLWRLVRGTPPMPAHWPALERSIASRTHIALYVLLIVLSVSGYVHVIGGGFPIELLNVFGVPPLIPEMPSAAMAASLVHRFASFLLVALVAVHVAEVLRHHLVERDGELSRMWPPVGGKDAAAPETHD